MRQVTWIGPGLLGAAVGEDLVRVWDLGSDESYVLSLTGASLDKQSRAVSIAFDPVRRFLAAGSRDGRIALWQYVGELMSDAAVQHAARPSSSVADWQPQPPV